MQRYSDYNDSGVEWLGKIPVHWDAGHAKRWFRIVNGGTPQSSVGEYWDGEVVWLTPEDLGQNQGHRIEGGRRMITVAGLQSCSASLCPKGSLVVSTRAPIGHLAITATNAATNQGCRTLVPGPQIDSTFGYYAVESARQVLESLGQGSTFMELTPANLGSVPLPLPPLDEQRDIAAFLDRETERIDSLIAKKRLLIERLQEYRTALITRTVTRGLPPEAARAAGLDPSPRLKPSGVEWLGDVPEHWDVQCLKRLVSLQSGATPSKARDDFWDGDIPWVSPKDMKRAELIDAEDHISLAAVRESSVNILPLETVLIVVRGMILAHSFPVAMTGAPLAINQDMKALRSKSDVVQHYLYWALIGFGDRLVRLTDESAHGTRRLETTTVGALQFPVPPRQEQSSIVSFLETRVSGIDGLLARISRAIERQQEYRTALITAAVTGKIDVRETASSDRGPAESQP